MLPLHLGSLVQTPFILLPKWATSTVIKELYFRLESGVVLTPYRLAETVKSIGAHLNVSNNIYYRDCIGKSQRGAHSDSD
jgi:hypothetical protein